ncbi:MAG: hypothetical protein WCP65_02915, partial [Bacteroidota bacterium]
DHIAHEIGDIGYTWYKNSYGDPNSGVIHFGDQYVYGRHSDDGLTSQNFANGYFGFYGDDGNYNSTYITTGTDVIFENGLTHIQGIDLTLDGTSVFHVDENGDIKGKSLTTNSLSTSDINALSPSVGMMVYNSTLHTICFWNGTSWQKVSSTNMN